MKNSIRKSGSLFLSTAISVFFLLTVSCMGNVPRSISIEQAERKVSVLGSSTVYAMPNQALISFSIVSKNKELSSAKAKNDETVKKVNGLFEKYKVEQKDITIEHITIHPRYSYNESGIQNFLYYEIIQNISVVITNIDNYEPFLTDILNANVERINNISFTVKDIRKYKDEARIAAVKAAEEKAVLLCSAFTGKNKGLKIGKVISISEIPQRFSGAYGYASQNSAVLMNKEENLQGFSPVGQVQITAEVEAVFQLKE
ncbi:SIMPL domain-containing protein [Treponema pedis]|uniref:SIMPL domain-containing protein n=1 Tax=Treponema pedis TaxID=409322 RepID=A0A7S6WRI5_9SPIR|nr:SIMPL domain-containing protein [Treponema pedis]QOW62013.1 SIMPL domain-containing protein [Treponema pedis]